MKIKNGLNNGFTLLEVLVALAIFAILATLTASSMYYAFNTKARTTIQADRMMTLQLAMTIVKQNIAQIINRPIRRNETQLLPAFIGLNTYLEFTKMGFNNPLSEDKRSTLQRVALLCKDHQLRQRTWHQLDALNHKQYNDKVLLEDVKTCQFTYYNQSLQLLSQWHSNVIGQSILEPLPQAIKVTLSIPWGQLTQVLVLPQAFYVSHLSTPTNE
jgi:general secretion pathway protein J